MKKLLVGLILLSLFVVGGQVTADPADEPSEALSPDLTLMETINDIPVPYRVLLDTQMNYQGYAVVTVHEISRGGKEMYRLHIASGDYRSRENIYLLYDKSWKFVGDEKSLAPLPVRRDEPKPEPANTTPPMTIEEPEMPAEEEPLEEEPDGSEEEDEEDSEEEVPEEPRPGRPNRNR